jgi:hypothetical protein
MRLRMRRIAEPFALSNSGEREKLYLKKMKVYDRYGENEYESSSVLK